MKESAKLILICFFFFEVTNGITNVIKLPTVFPHGKSTEEIWIYPNKKLKSTTIYLFYGEYYSSIHMQENIVELYSACIHINSGYYIYNSASSSMTPKFRHWTHIAVTMTDNNDMLHCSLYVNGIRYPCNNDCAVGTYYKVFLIMKIEIVLISIYIKI